MIFIRRTLVLAALVALSSCAQIVEADPQIEVNPGSEGEMVFRLTAEDSRSTLGPSYSVAWEAGDEVAIWDGLELRKFTGKDSGEGIVFSGTAANSNTYWALYPWSDDCVVDATDPNNPVFKTTLPREQKLRKNGFPRGAALSLGKGTKDGIAMKNVCGYLKFSFPDASIPALKPGSLDSIVVSSPAGKKLVGSVSLKMNGSVPQNSAALSVGDDVLNLSFEGAPEAGASYYFCVLPVDLGTAGGGVQLDFSRSADCAKARISGGAGKSNVVERSAALDLGTLWPRWRAEGEAADDASADPSGSFDYSLLSRISHPRVLASDEDFRHLLSLLGDDSYPLLTSVHLKVIANADSYVGKAIPTIAELVVGSDGSFQNVFNEKLARPSIGHLVCCAYAYRTTGLEKYLEECRRVIALRTQDDFWWKSSVAYISTAEIAMGMAVAYDWLYYDLSETERASIRTALTTLPFTYGSTYDESGTVNQLRKEKNNRGQVDNAGILATALAMYDKDKAFSKKWTEKTFECIGPIMDYIYGKTGSTEEGYGYWSYGANYQAWYNEMLLAAFGNDGGLGDKQGFINTPYYFLFLSDYMSPFAFSDGGRSSISTSMALWWMAARRQNTSFLTNEKYLYDKGSTMAHRVMPILPLVLSKCPKMDLGSISRPEGNIWADSNDSNIPVVLVRTGWNNNESDKYLGLKGGYAAVSHGHMDAGTFEYHSSGQRWVVDNSVGSYAHYTNAGLSSSSQKTSSAGTYVKWLAMAYNSLGHSTISFANYDQSVGGIAKTHSTDHLVSSDAKVGILETYDTPAQRGGKLDMSPALKGQVASATRKAVIVEDSYLLVEDCITALQGSDAEMIWRMVTPANAKIDGNRIRLSLGGKVMYVEPKVSGGLKPVLKVWGGYDDSHPGKTGEWGWTSSDYKVNETISANVVGFTLTIPAGTSATVSTTLKEQEKQDDTPDFTLSLDFSSAGAAFTTSLPTSKVTGTVTYKTKTGNYNVTFQALEKGGNQRGAGWYYSSYLRFYPDKQWSSSFTGTPDGITFPAIPGKRLVKVKLKVGASASFRAYVINSDGTEVFEDTDPSIFNSNGNWLADATAVFNISFSEVGQAYRMVGRSTKSFIYIDSIVLEYKTEKNL